jgi:hypothetical protein
MNTANMTTDWKQCTADEGKVIGRNHGKRIDLGNGRTAVVEFNRFVEKSGAVNQVGLAIMDMRMLAGGKVDEECVEIVRKYFPQAFQAPPSPSLVFG